ncbi:hypothetical protein O3Q52_30115 [Streptomyces sp. ActVer]|uniref:hypothetical protein n=1 Tax=Streptomyces sp. ActVer TaxID=3014558 RepID=UPI0022B35CD6|nr:hypothetical protein [Streptomyces sp. ActVer]MCZ4512347.1 hypothetical protein [Streptomyces sp. ActVer]
MARNVEAYSALRDLPAHFLAGFCLGCAERGSGIFVTLADPEDAEWFSQVLEVAWKAPLGEVDEDELIEILEDFETRTESMDVDDPGSRGFSVVQSAMLAVNAIAVHLNPSPARAEMSGQTLETVMGSFDFKLGGSEVVITRAGEDEGLGRLQRMEQDAQNAFVESVRALTGDQAEPRLGRDFLESLRQSCAPVRDEFKAATSSVAELAGWDQE